MAIIEQGIIDAVVARMETITTANGYQTDIGETVEDSRPNWGEDDKPATSVFEGTVTSDTSTDEKTVRRTMPVMITTSLQRQDTAGADAQMARKVLRDIMTAVGTDPTWGGLARYTDEVKHGIQYAPDSFEVTGAEVELNVIYYANRFNMES